MSNQIAQVVLGLPVEGPFDYAVHSELRKNIQVGQRVLVSFNRQKRVAYVVALKARSAFKKLNPILEILDNIPSVTPKRLALAEKMHQYYGCSLGEAIETTLPKVMRQRRAVALEAPALPEDQRRASFCLWQSFSLEAQWAHVREAAQATLARQEGVLLIVPEKDFQKRLEEKCRPFFKEKLFVAAEKPKVQEEVDLFQKLYRGESCVYLGTRSAVFAPMPRPGLIVVFQEENSAYKQEQSPRYHAGLLARLRAEIEPCRLLLISAIPSTESYKRARSAQWEFKEDPVAKKAGVQVVDMTNYNPRRSWIVSFPLQNQIQKYLEEGKKVLLFLNRRGFSLRTQCNQCGYQLRCERCDISLTYIYAQKKLVCRGCQKATDLPKVCPQCRSTYLRSTGSGVEKIESELARIYPQAHVAVFDRESQRLAAKANLVVATQAILREQDHFRPDLVAVLNIDSALHHFDYRSWHHAFTLLVRLYHMAADKLLIQTKLPEMVHIRAIKNVDFKLFYQEDLKQRKELSLPPFSFILTVGLRGKVEEAVFEAASALHAVLEKEKPEGVEVLDPQPDAVPKLRDQYRCIIMLKAKSLPKVHRLVKAVLKKFKKRNVIVTLDVDP